MRIEAFVLNRAHPPPPACARALSLNYFTQEHGRFEDPYKAVCVCRLEGAVLRVRATERGEVVGEEERLDLCAWKLLPRADKADRFTLTRGVGPGGGAEEAAVVTFKAESKEEGKAWTAAIQASAASLTPY